MNLIYLKLFCLIFLVFAMSCEKENQILEQGKYSGTFKVVYNSDTVKTGAVTLELNAGMYTCSGNKNKIPAGGSGNYSFEKNKIKFIDVGIWTANFDWGLILNGEYNYTFDGKRLKIWSHKNDIGYYEYDLVKTSSMP